MIDCDKDANNLWCPAYLGSLMDSLIGEGARPRDDTDNATLMNGCRHNSNFTLSGKTLELLQYTYIKFNYYFILISISFKERMSDHTHPIKKKNYFKV